MNHYHLTFVVVMIMIGSRGGGTVGAPPVGAHDRVVNTEWEDNDEEHSLLSEGSPTG